MSAIPRSATLAVAAVVMLIVPVEGQSVRPDISRERAEAQAVMQHPVFQQAMRYVEQQQADPTELVEAWLGLCEAVGPSGDEIYRSRHIKTLFQIYGLENVHIDGALNVIGIRPGVGDGPTVVLNAHHDQVALFDRDQPIRAYVAEDRVWCPAAGDDLIGVVQMLGVLAAMNLANLETLGDVWFVTVTGEETDFRGARHFARANYPHHIDWEKGDVVMQFHGSGGVGATTGSSPLIHDAKLWFFTPFERQIEGEVGSDRRWRPHAVDALAHSILRIREELTDPTRDCLRCDDAERADFYINMAMVGAVPVRNTPAAEAWVRLDLRAYDPEGMARAHREIMRIAEEACQQVQDCSYQFEVMSRLGRYEPIPGFDNADNRGARMAAAAGEVLYGFPGSIDPSRGCGDCQGMFMEGLPSMSFRGDVIDWGGGRFERSDQFAQYGGLDSQTRRRTSGHHATQSQAIVTLWSGIKHGLLFTTAYAGLADRSRDD